MNESGETERRLPASMGGNWDCSLLYLNLLGHKQGAGLVIMADLVEFDLIGSRWRKPSAADDANFASTQSQFWNVLHQTDKIINMRRPHSILHERWANCPDLSNYFAFLPLVFGAVCSLTLIPAKTCENKRRVRCRSRSLWLGVPFGMECVGP